MEKVSIALAGLLFAVGLGTGGYFMHRIDRNVQPQATDTSIVFPDKNFTDTVDYVSVTGRWEGAGVPYRNNSVMIACDHSTSQCTYYNVEQIGQNQIGDLDIPTSIPITKWSNYEISGNDAEQIPDYACVKTTINIDRKRETAELVTEPINQASLSCAKADNKIYKWFLAGSLWYDQMRERTAAAKNGK